MCMCLYMCVYGLECNAMYKIRRFCARKFKLYAYNYSVSYIIIPTLVYLTPYQHTSRRK